MVRRAFAARSLHDPRKLRMMKARYLLPLLFAGALHGQISAPVTPVNVYTAPSGACSPGAPPQQVVSTGSIYTCQSSTWAQISGGGGGSITGVTAGTGLSGGGTTGNVTVNLSTPVSTANGGTVSVGTSFIINSYTALAAIAVDTSLVCWQIN